MARSKSAVLKGGTSRAVKKASKLKELQAELNSLDKQLTKLSKERTKIVTKLDKLLIPVVKTVDTTPAVTYDDGDRATVAVDTQAAVAA